MADTATGSPLPVPGPGQRAGKNAQTKAIAREQQQRRETFRNRDRPFNAAPQVDGTQSDSVTNPAASPRPKKQHKPRQSVPNSAQPMQNGNMGRANGHKPRPVSLGGPMLPATPLKEQAYAGPTFHASPAPSSLPMPKFFSRSAPKDSNPLQARMESEKTPEKQEFSPEPDVVEPSIPREAQASPLDLLFKADKEQKEKTRSISMLSPETATRRVPATETRNPFQQSGKSVFLREMDGESDDLPSPRTVPKNNRPVPTERARSSPGSVPQTADDKQAYTQSLKDLLFNTVNNPRPQKAAPAPHTQPRAHPDAQTFHTPSPYQRSASNPTTPAPSGEPANYHYGNRNLSPLFKAARADTPSRPSSLRQEIANGYVNAKANGHPPAPPPQPRQMPQVDPNSFSCDYLNQQISSAAPSSLPQLPYMNGVSVNGHGPSASVSGPSPVPHHDVSGPGAGATTSGAATSRDVRSMEDDLRRMLKLDVLG